MDIASYTTNSGGINGAFVMFKKLPDTCWILHGVGDTFECASRSTDPDNVGGAMNIVSDMLTDNEACRSVVLETSRDIYKYLVANGFAEVPPGDEFSAIKGNLEDIIEKSIGSTFTMASLSGYGGPSLTLNQNNDVYTMMNLTAGILAVDIGDGKSIVINKDGISLKDSNDPTKNKVLVPV